MSAKQSFVKSRESEETIPYQKLKVCITSEHHMLKAGSESHIQRSMSHLYAKIQTSCYLAYYLIAYYHYLSSIVLNYGRKHWLDFGHIFVFSSFKIKEQTSDSFKSVRIE